MMPTYRVDRLYMFGERRRQRIATGFTLAEAQAHCSDPETSSSTCTSAEGKRRTRKYGPWFDSYAEERNP